MGLLGILPVHLGHWLSALGFCANYYTGSETWYVAHFWSLSVEEHFYLFWPITLGLLGAKRACRLGIALALVVGAWRLFDYTFQVFPKPSWRTDTQLDGLMWGCVFAILHHDTKWQRWFYSRIVEAKNGMRWSMQAVVAVGLLSVAFRQKMAIPTGGLKMWISPLFAFSIPCLLVYTILRPNSWLGVVLELPLLQSVGRLSYSLYLWQQLFLVTDQWRLQALAPFQSFPLNFDLALVCAGASFFVLEKPLVAYGNKLSRKARFPAEGIAKESSVVSA